MKIGLFDSGKGGTTVLSAIRKLLPDNEYCYIADSENCPYGEKTEQELLKIVCNNVDKLKKWGAEIVVFACNTATTKCIGRVREMYPELEFVGTEPAIGLIKKYNAKRVLIMATPATVKSERVASLIKNNRRPGQIIDLLACPGLALAIENNDKIDEVLEKLTDGCPNYDLVVLGCTHYSLIKDKIQKRFADAIIIDGNDGVARRVKELASKR